VARDSDSASLIADQAFGEALAILNVVDPDGRSSIDAGLIIAGGGKATYREQTGWPPVLNRYFDQDGDLAMPEFLLSEIASKPLGKRGQLERSTLGAAHWYSLGVNTTWVSHALIAHMTALEALFIFDRRESRKGDLIAERASRIVLGPQKTRLARRKWLKRLYNRRNYAIHEVLDFQDEVEVERLQSVVAAAISWILMHLDPSDGCKTTKAAFEHHKREARRRL
jgi:hypothetical protein